MQTQRATGSAPLKAPTAPAAAPLDTQELSIASYQMSVDTTMAVDKMLLGHALPEVPTDPQSEEVRRKLVKLGQLTSLTGKTLEVETQKALLAFQRANGLAPTGAADAPTIAKMDELIASKVDAFVPQPKSQFLKNLLPSAIELEKKYGIPAAVVLAQAALESDYGKKAIGTFNIFGIKGKGSQGTLEVTTHEYVKGVRKKVKEPFAHFENYTEALKQHAEVFFNGHYNKALKFVNDPKGFAKAIQGIYATDPRYARKLTAIMKSQNLIPPDPPPVKKTVAKK